MNGNFNSHSHEVLSRLDSSLPDRISSLSDQFSDNMDLVENLKGCISHLNSLNISEIDILLNPIIESIKTKVLGIFDENFIMADDVSYEDTILNSLRENLKVVIDLLEILKFVLKFVSEQTLIKLKQIKITAIMSIEIVSSTFDHCRKSPKSYKDNFGQELLDIFNLAQEANFLFIEIFESTKILTDSINEEDIQFFLKVLDNLYDISEVSYYLNTKVWTINWKGYIGIVQKYLHVLKNHIDLKKMIVHLTSITYVCLMTIVDTENMDTVQFASNIKKLKLTIKVTMKIFDIFWDVKHKQLRELMEYFCVIYCFPSYIFESPDYYPQTPSIIEESIFSQTNLRLTKCLLEGSLFQVLQNNDFLNDKYSTGLLNIIHFLFKYISTNELITNLQLDILLKYCFKATKMCFHGFMWPQSIFDSLVTNITASVINYGQYDKIESILLENILQEEIWNFFLAMEVWCLLLRNAPPRFSGELLTNLNDIYNNLEFGRFTYRLEKVYLKFLINRVFCILPNNFQSQICQNNNVLKNIELQHLPKEIKCVVQEVHQDTLKKINEVGSERFTDNDLITLAENLEMLSNVNFKEMCIDPTNLMNALESIWELKFTDMENNNLFKYFIAKVFKITSGLAVELNNKQLYMVFNQLAHLSTYIHYKCPISLMLVSFILINSNELGQDGCKMISFIIINLLQNSNIIIKQKILEVLALCERNSKQSVIKEVSMKYKNMQTIIREYITKSFDDAKFDSDYFKSVRVLEYQHNCMEWKRNDGNKCAKRFKSDIPKHSAKNDNFFNGDNTEKHIEDEMQTNENSKKKETVKYSLQKFRYKPYKKDIPEETVQEIDDINDVLCRLKGEVKCLMNVLKNEKLTSKNVADLKIITNQLSSLM